MDSNSINDLQKIAFEQFKDIERGDLEYAYRGDFTPQLVVDILNLAKSNLDKSDDTNKVSSKIYFIMGEGLQNITRHREPVVEENSDMQSMFVINKKRHKYFITTGNVIENISVDSLRQKLDTINSLSHEELRNFHRLAWKNGSFSEKGGAGLGLIEMAKKSKNKLAYDFNALNDKYSFFYLSTEIPTQQTPDDMSNPSDNNKYSISHIKDLHQFLNGRNIMLFFKGAFDQENLLNLLSIVEGQMQGTAMSAKLFNIMVELLQNIVKHADNPSNSGDWKPGIFFINDTGNEIFLTAGNYIHNDKVPELKEKIELVNTMNSKELIAYYNKILLNFEHGNSTKTGLGIIDIRKKSGTKLNFNFYQLDSDFNFFILQTSIIKK